MISNGLHSSYLRLRQLAKLSKLTTPLSRAFSSVEPKVLEESLSPEVFEFKLNQPKILNSLDLDMVDLMLARIRAWNSAPESQPGVVLISGVGEKAFCAGGDIKSVYMAGARGKNPSLCQDFFYREY